MGSRNVRQTHNEHLKNIKVAAEYINHALASEDASIILMAIRNVVDAQEGGITKVAEKSALGRESMYKILSPNGNPKLTTLSSLFHGLGMKITVCPEEDIEDNNGYKFIVSNKNTPDGSANHISC